MTTNKEAKVAKEPEADDNEGTYKEDPNDRLRRFGEIIGLLDAEKLAADWEDGPLEVAEAVQGSHEPCT